MVELWVWNCKFDIMTSKFNPDFGVFFLKALNQENNGMIFDIMQNTYVQV